MSPEINSSKTNTKIKFQYNLANNKILENWKTHKLAQIVIKKSRNIKSSFFCFPIARSVFCKKIARIKVIKDNTNLSQSKTGYFVKFINKKRPSCYTYMLYNSKCKCMLPYYINYAWVSAN